MSSSSHRVFRAPGRVNLIGEHTDYNDGFVMPVAINFSTRVDLLPIPERRIEIYSELSGRSCSSNLIIRLRKRRGHWSDYPVGVASMLLEAGYELSGARLSIQSDVPIGSGLSSSAALEVATAYALNKASNLNIEQR